jgi:hypothetical protein
MAYSVNPVSSSNFIGIIWQDAHVKCNRIYYAEIVCIWNKQLVIE